MRHFCVYMRVSSTDLLRNEILRSCIWHALRDLVNWSGRATTTQKSLFRRFQALLLLLLLLLLQLLLMLLLWWSSACYLGSTRQHTANRYRLEKMSPNWESMYVLVERSELDSLTGMWRPLNGSLFLVCFLDSITWNVFKKCENLNSTYPQCRTRYAVSCRVVIAG